MHNEKYENNLPGLGVQVTIQQYFQGLGLGSLCPQGPLQLALQLFLEIPFPSKFVHLQPEEVKKA